jgi:hypothetical protein
MIWARVQVAGSSCPPTRPFTPVQTGSGHQPYERTSSAGHVSECSPGHYDDTLYDVPSGASVRLLIEATGEPSVVLMDEPSGLPHLTAQPVMGTLNEADLCEYIRTHSPQ